MTAKNLQTDLNRPGPGAAPPDGPAGRALLQGARDELLGPVGAVLAISAKLLGEARDLGQDAFAADLDKIHRSALRFRELLDEVFDPARLAPLDAAALKALQSRVRHDMLNA